MLNTRKATTKDINDLIRLRKCQLQDEGQEPDTDIDDSLRHFFYEKMIGNELIEWVAEEEDGRLVASAAILFMDFPPSFVHPAAGKTGYITNVYTEDAYRGQGIAGMLLRQLEKEARRKGIKRLMLHASKMGIRAYEKSGYAETDRVMEKKID